MALWNDDGLNDLLNSGFTMDDVKVLLKCKTQKQLLSQLKSVVGLNDVLVLDCWSYVINSCWKGLTTKEERESVFNESELIFFRELLKNGGVLCRKDCEKLMPSYYVLNEVVKSFEEQYVAVLKLKSWRVVYVVHPKFLEEVSRNG